VIEKVIVSVAPAVMVAVRSIIEVLIDSVFPLPLAVNPFTVAAILVPVSRVVLRLDSKAPLPPSLITSTLTKASSPYCVDTSERTPLVCEAFTPVASDTRLMASTILEILVCWSKVNTSVPLFPASSKVRVSSNTPPPV